MALDLYSSCPCGSGKKFKWCCQPIYTQIERAFIQDAEGQHDVALRLMDELVKQHPNNPEAWGRMAQLLYQNGRAEDAEKALEKAFSLNPSYPFGLLLRGNFRYNEGEIPGALLLFRKATDAYDPEALDHLGQVYELIADCELKLNRPVAALAALRLAAHCRPDDQELRQTLETIGGDKSSLPEPARREYRFQSPTPTTSGARRAAWDRALAGGRTPRLSDAARTFETLANEDPQDAAAWYNLGLARAWLGENQPALEALDRYVALEPDEEHAAAAWALGEVLRFGTGMAEVSDHHDWSVSYEVRDFAPVGQLLEDWNRAHRLLPMPSDRETGLFSALILEGSTSLIVGPSAAAPSRFAAYLLIYQPQRLLRIWGPNKESLDRLRGEMEHRLSVAIGSGQERSGLPSFADVAVDAFLFPVGITDRTESERRVREYAQGYFEETWLHRPLRSLNGVPPVDAAGHPVLRKKLRGVLQFLQACTAGGALATAYDFDRLRHKLGLSGAPAPAAPTAPSVPAASVGDISAMSAADLTALAPEGLSDEQAEQAYQMALRLDAREVAGKFAQSLVARPPRPERPDRFPWYSHLISLALAEGKTDLALDLLNEAEKADCEQNEGRRRNDYELRRGQIHARRGEADQAQDVFERLIGRVPDNLRYRGQAVEALLSARQGARALGLAEQALAEARKQDNRDEEQHFLELVAAAKKQGGV